MTVGWQDDMCQWCNNLMSEADHRNCRTAAWMHRMRVQPEDTNLTPLEPHPNDYTYEQALAAAWERASREVEVLLSCGCAQTVHPRSSLFDYPECMHHDDVTIVAVNGNPYIEENE